jgi:hypothetical protein
MPAPLNPKSVILFASTVSPIFITFYFILEGAFNGNVKFVFYLVGLFIAIMLGILLRGGGNLKTNMNDPMQASSDAQEFVRKCMTFDGPFNASYSFRKGPSSHAIFHFFTIMYILLSVLNNPYDVGWPFVITLVIIASTDLAIRNSNGCSSPSDLIKGAVLGLFIGIIWWQIIANTTWPGPEYLYFGKENTMKKCKLSKTRFKCKRDNGEEIIV